MYLRSRSVPLYLVAALTGALSASVVASAQTIAPPAPTDGGAVTKASVEPKADTIQAPVTSSALAAPASAESTPATPTTIDVAAALDRAPALDTFAKADREGLLAAYKAREGRPIWMSAKGATPEALRLAAELAKARDWGLDPAAFHVPDLAGDRVGAADLSPEAMADADVRLSLATLKYARFARGGRLDPTGITPYLDRKPPLLDPASVLEQIATATDPDVYLRKLNPQNPQFERLRERYLAVRDEPAPKTGPSEADRILANMEQWRWMPADLGHFYVTANIPEQLLRVVRDGEVIHTERIVVGKSNAQTPIFSNEMKHIIFHPFWGVPDSIKVNELLPALKRGRKPLARQNLRLQLDGKDVDPARYDWSRTDIRRFHVYQPPSSGNALGIVKFMFPNKHAVYMHDTPSKSLFKSSVRAFSHGCMRVQNPVRFAELLLAEDRGMSVDQVRALTRKDAPENNQVNLTEHIPVHMTYFTMAVGEDGKVTTFKDLYGHEERVRLALAGRMDEIQPVSEPKTPTDPIGRLVEVSPGFGGFDSDEAPSGYSGGSSYSPTRPAWARQVFSGGGAFSGGN